MICIFYLLFEHFFIPGNRERVRKWEPGITFMRTMYVNFLVSRQTHQQCCCECFSFVKASQFVRKMTMMLCFGENVCDRLFLAPRVESMSSCVVYTYTGRKKNFRKEPLPSVAKGSIKHHFLKHKSTYNPHD